MKTNLEKRMYFLVLGSLQGISKGIMCGHAALEYAHKYNNDPEYIDFIENWKTWIILNGGTTNNDCYGRRGSLNLYLDKIIEFNDNNPNCQIKYRTFNETDLNDALTAICLIVDERVFNRVDYPDFEEWCEFKSGTHSGVGRDDLYQLYVYEYGKKTVFLKELLNSRKLA